jgi:hypothetical protein
MSPLGFAWQARMMPSVLSRALRVVKFRERIFLHIVHVHFPVSTQWVTRVIREGKQPLMTREPQITKQRRGPERKKSGKKKT